MNEYLFAVILEIVGSLFEVIFGIILTAIAKKLKLNL